MWEPEYSVEAATKASASAKAGSPLKIRCIKRNDLCREYVLVGRLIPSAPDTSSFTGPEVTATFQGGKLVVTVTHQSQWIHSNQAAANAVARTVGGSHARPA